MAWSSVDVWLVWAVGEVSRARARDAVCDVRTGGKMDLEKIVRGVPKTPRTPHPP